MSSCSLSWNLHSFVHAVTTSCQISTVVSTTVRASTALRVLACPMNGTERAAIFLPVQTFRYVTAVVSSACYRLLPPARVLEWTRKYLRTHIRSLPVVLEMVTFLRGAMPESEGHGYDGEEHRASTAEVAPSLVNTILSPVPFSRRILYLNFLFITYSRPRKDRKINKNTFECLMLLLHHPYVLCTDLHHLSRTPYYPNHPASPLLRRSTGGPHRGRY